MAARVVAAAIGIVAVSANGPAAAADGLCRPLREFVESVNAGETRVLEFHTILGGNFKDRSESATGAKRCEYRSYELAKAVCKYFMEFGSIDLAGHNAKLAISCLSPKTQFAAGTRLNAISFTMKYGAEDRGSFVDVSLAEDKQLGGMVLTISAAGF